MDLGQELIGQGTGDNFYLDGQLLPENFAKAAKDGGVDGVNIRYHNVSDTGMASVPILTLLGVRSFVLFCFDLCRGPCSACCQGTGIALKARGEWKRIRTNIIPSGGNNNI